MMRREEKGGEGRRRDEKGGEGRRREGDQYGRGQRGAVVKRSERKGK